MDFIFNYKNKGKNRNIKIKNVKRIKGIIGKGTGLMFKSSNTDALLFEFNKPIKEGIHSLFVFFPFVAVWLDDKNRIIEKRVILPFTLLAKPKKEFKKLLEIPINSKYSKVTSILIKNSTTNRKI